MAPMHPLLTLEHFYLVIGAILAVVSGRIVLHPDHPRRWGSAAFWGMLAVTFLLGKILPSIVSGYLVLAMVVLAALKQVEPPLGKAAVKPGEEAEAGAFARREAERLGNRIFWPALLIPIVAVVGSLVFGKIHWGTTALVEPRQVTLVALGAGALLALVAAMRVTGARAKEPVVEGSRLLESIGWALILPQLLAALGGIFAQAGVGPVVADLVTHALPTQYPVVAIAAYCLGMALFTMCMGNAFAAFAVITGGIGLPLIVQAHHGDPAIMAAIGMLAGYCGTLLTPMAANFNLVPALLLELPDRNAVIKAQAPIALVLLLGNILLMWAFV